VACWLPATISWDLSLLQSATKLSFSFRAACPPTSCQSQRFSGCTTLPPAPSLPRLVSRHTSQILASTMPKQRKTFANACSGLPLKLQFGTSLWCAKWCILLPFCCHTAKTFSCRVWKRTRIRRFRKRKRQVVWLGRTLPSAQIASKALWVK
jgi:hypothetical protein